MEEKQPKARGKRKVSLEGEEGQVMCFVQESWKALWVEGEGVMRPQLEQRKGYQEDRHR